MADSLILMVLALVVFGPRRLPQIGRQIGKLMYEFRKASNDFKFQMEEELRVAEEADRRKKEEAQRQQLMAAQPAQESVSATAAVASSVTVGPAADAAALREATPAAETPEPRILPPSTGETVASTRRPEPAEKSDPAEISESAELAQLKEPPQDLPAARNDDAPATETVRHNG